MRAIRISLLAVLGFFAAGAAHAQVTVIWRCVDAQGNVLFTSQRDDTQGKKCSVVSRERLNVIPRQPGSVRAPSPANFPRESSGQRQQAQHRQRQVLEQELVQEQGLLAKAKKALAAQEAVRYGNEHNYQRVLDRLKPYKEKVEEHQQNILAIKRELAALNDQ